MNPGQQSKATKNRRPLSDKGNAINLGIFFHGGDDTLPSVLYCCVGVCVLGGGGNLVNNHALSF